MLTDLNIRKRKWWTLYYVKKMRRFISTKLPFYRTEPIIAGSSQFFTDSSKSILYVSFKASKTKKAKKGNIARAWTAKTNKNKNLFFLQYFTTIRSIRTFIASLVCSLLLLHLQLMISFHSSHSSSPICNQSMIYSRS